jgi:hypothetical protein
MRKRRRKCPKKLRAKFLSNMPFRIVQKKSGGLERKCRTRILRLVPTYPAAAWCRQDKNTAVCVAPKLDRRTSRLPASAITPRRARLRRRESQPLRQPAVIIRKPRRNPPVREHAVLDGILATFQKWYETILRCRDSLPEGLRYCWSGGCQGICEATPEEAAAAKDILEVPRRLAWLRAVALKGGHRMRLHRSGGRLSGGLA